MFFAMISSLIFTPPFSRNDTLKRIWYLADIDKDGQLDLEEFLVAMHLVETCQKNIPLPSALPVSLIPSSKLSTPF